MQVFIQSDSAGLSLFSNSFDKPIYPGDSVTVTGEIKQYFGLTEIEVEHYEVYADKIGAPKSITLNRAIHSPEVYEGMLVAGPGVVKAKGNRYNGKYVMIAPAENLQ